MIMLFEVGLHRVNLHNKRKLIEIDNKLPIGQDISVEVSVWLREKLLKLIQACSYAPCLFPLIF